MSKQKQKHAKKRMSNDMSNDMSWFTVYLRFFHNNCRHFLKVKLYHHLPQNFFESVPWVNSEN